MQTTNVVITDPVGLHARPAAELVRSAAKYKAKVRLQFGNKWADARSIVQLLGLAVRQGSEITVTAEGDDEAEALAAVVAVLTKE